jgi:hypothetical protein
MLILVLFKLWTRCEIQKSYFGISEQLNANYSIDCMVDHYVDNSSIIWLFRNFGLVSFPNRILSYKNKNEDA